MFSTRRRGTKLSFSCFLSILQGYAFSILCRLLVVESVKPLAQFSHVFDGGLDGREAIAVGRVMHPESDITRSGIFLLHVMVESLPLSVSVQGRFFFQSVLHGPPEDGLRIEVAIGFGNDFSV